MIDALLLSSDVLLYVSRNSFFSLYFSHFSLSLSRLDRRVDGSYYVMFFFALVFAIGAYLALTLHRSNRVLVVDVEKDISRFSCLLSCT
jgi:hypothetical protein